MTTTDFLHTFLILPCLLVTCLLFCCVFCRCFLVCSALLLPGLLLPSRLAARLRLARSPVRVSRGACTVCASDTRTMSEPFTRAGASAPRPCARCLRRPTSYVPSPPPPTR